jgi:phosphoenolpyruvate carboxykinase (GTP)
MLIVGLQDPQGKITYIAGAFPSACGKTNLAMLIPPEEYAGWKIWTVGDDICWMQVGEDGRLWAVNPEAGFFGVAPGTGADTNPNALKMIEENTIFTNVGVTADNQPWWEGKDVTVPVADWRGNPYDPEVGPAAHPNSRFTVSMKRCPTYSDKAEAKFGVPISAIVLGGRRERLVPLVMKSKSWQHGVLLGASMGSETTAAAIGAVGTLRRDPMAMKPFCGYNFADYWSHWLSFTERAGDLPPVYHVNWFRKNEQGEFMWPGFAQNMRVLDWIIRNLNGEVGVNDTAIGGLPAIEDINTSGLDTDHETLEALLEVDVEAWLDEAGQIREYLEEYGERVPAQLLEELDQVVAGLKAAG